MWHLSSKLISYFRTVQLSKQLALEITTVVESIYSRKSFGSVDGSEADPELGVGIVVSVVAYGGILRLRKLQDNSSWTMDIILANNLHTLPF